MLDIELSYLTPPHTHPHTGTKKTKTKHPKCQGKEKSPNNGHNEWEGKKMAPAPVSGMEKNPKGSCSSLNKTDDIINEITT